MHSHLCGFRCVDADAKNLHCLRHWVGREIWYIRPLKETEEEGEEETEEKGDEEGEEETEEEGEEEMEEEGEEEKGEART